ncbi:MAG: PEP-CTERM sorting domain-containing protein [Candidatus Omnitrophota bacterium]
MKKSMLILIVFCLILITQNANANTSFVLLSDDFDLENGGLDLGNYNNFLNWDVVEGGVDLCAPYTQWYHDMPSWVGSYIDLDGTGQGGGKMVSKEEFKLLPGLYELQFDIKGSICPYSDRTDELNDILMVSLGGLFSETFTIPQEYSFTTVTRYIDIQSRTDGQLIFDQTTGHDDMGPLLDNVKLTRNVGHSPVPEPATMLLFGPAFLGLIGYKRRRG